MTRSPNTDRVHLAGRDWLGLAGMLLVHAGLLFGRVMVLESKVTHNEKRIDKIEASSQDRIDKIEQLFIEEIRELRRELRARPATAHVGLGTRA